MWLQHNVPQNPILIIEAPVLSSAFWIIVVLLWAFRFDQMLCMVETLKGTLSYVRQHHRWLTYHMLRLRQCFSKPQILNPPNAKP